ncbi:rhomboid family intramembrane serine protease [Flavobacterium sp. SUN046]|uniref:rhomboid family intramembrane serine protease n=1 Tax=Flavobacterium sp. SUN046 TaxID=3002440 RepID=UPI002DB90FCB|nr:rhomboid family intramembrane serine protease [Flavobacterium sp. SUN046]MEC4048397.1 rhomboid family intramembrane serine protease [Flavobacterium sp. SUN046]
MNPDFLLFILIGCNVLISLKGFYDSNFFRQNEFHIGSIRDGQQFRMISSAFLHVDIAHLAFNMIALYSFAPIITHFMGNFSFLIIYFGSLIFGSVLTLAMHKDQYQYRAVGASGAVTGIIYAAILIFPGLEVNIMFIPIPINGLVFGLLYLLYSIYGMKAKNDNIGHTAHFGGAIGGFAITLLKRPDLFTVEPFTIIILAIPIIIMFVMAKMGKF